MKQHVMKFLREEEALTTVEYAIAGGLVGAAVHVDFTGHDADPAQDVLAGRSP